MHEFADIQRPGGWSAATKHQNCLAAMAYHVLATNSCQLARHSCARTKS